MPSLLVVIANYDFSENADTLKRKLSPNFPVVLIDASSPRPPKTTDISIPNTYYPGLWNEAVSQAITGSYDWLFFIASDVRVSDTSNLCKSLERATGHDQLGVWTPSLQKQSRCEAKLAFNKSTDAMRGCGYVEGFCFLARTSIVKQQHPIPAWNKSGWGVDVVTSFLAKEQGYWVAVDDRVQIYHPRARASHCIDKTPALEDYRKYRDEWGVDDEKLHRLFTADSHTVYMSTTRSLDLGCGTHPHNPFGATELHGIDIRNIRNEHMTVKAADLTLGPIPYPANHFDYITAYDFIEHIPRIIYAPKRRFPFIELMNEIWRCLKPGGILVSHTPAYPSAEAFQDPTHVNIITENTFPCYFSNDLWAKMYGFTGRFEVETQDWDGPHLHTRLRATK